MTGSASSCTVVRQDPPEQRGLHHLLRKSAVDDDDDDDVDDDSSEAAGAGADTDATRDDNGNESATGRGSPGSYHEELQTHDSSHDDRGGRGSPNSSSGPAYLRGLRRSLQDDFDRQLHWDSHHVNDDEYDNDDSDSCSSDADWYPRRRSHVGVDDADTDTDDDGFESTLEEMERSLDYHDYLEREVDAYLEEPMRQLMREMEKEMELSYQDEFTAEDSYDEAQSLPLRREHVEDEMMSSRQPNDLRERREIATTSSSSSYMSVQATIQHAILNYHNWALASSNS